MLLDDLLAKRTRATADAAVPPAGLRGVCVVTCSEPSLEWGIYQALGLGQGDAHVIRLPGGALGEASVELTRAVAAAVLLGGCSEVLVVAHTGCFLLEVTDAEARREIDGRGVSPTAVGLSPGRALGAFDSAHGRVRETANLVRRSPLLPRTIPVHALVLDDESGELEVVDRGYDLPGGASDEVSGARNVLGLAPGPIRFGEECLPPLLATSPLLADFKTELPSASPMQLERTVMPAVTQLKLTAELPTVSSIDWIRTVVGTGAMAVQPIMPPNDSAVSASPMDISSSLSALEVVRVEEPVIVRQPANWTQPGSPRAHPDWSAPAMIATEVIRPPPTPAAGRPSKAGRSAKVPVAVNAPHADLEGGVVHGEATVRLSQPLARSLVRIRDFYRAEFRPNTRREVVQALDEAAAAGRGPVELVKIAIKPVLGTGQKRYQVINDLVVVKEAVESLDRATAYGALRALLE